MADEAGITTRDQLSCTCGRSPAPPDKDVSSVIATWKHDSVPMILSGRARDPDSVCRAGLRLKPEASSLLSETLCLCDSLRASSVWIRWTDENVPPFLTSVVKTNQATDKETNLVVSN